MNSSAVTEENEKSSQVRSSWIIDLLVVCSGLAAPLGERLNDYIPRISQAYVAVGGMLTLMFILSAMFSNKRLGAHRFRKGKLLLISFLVFVALHTLLHSLLAESVIINTSKIMLFGLISLVLSESFRVNGKRVEYFLRAFSLSFVVVYFASNSLPGTRMEGAYENANAFAIDSLLCVFGSLYLLSRRQRNHLEHLLTLAIGAVALFLSGTRSVFGGTLLGVVAYVSYAGNASRRAKIAVAAIVVIAIIMVSVPSQYSLELVNRLFSGDSALSGYSNNIRLTIWLDYLRAWRTYIFFGSDMASWYLINSRVTHNTYLNVLVRFGWLGLLIFLRLVIVGLRQALTMLRIGSESQKLVSSMLIAMLVTSMFIDALTHKGYWIVWGIAFFAGSLSGSSNEKVSTD